MNANVYLALIGFGVTIVSTTGTVALAFLKLREKQDIVIHQTNGALTAERARVSRAHGALERAGVPIPPDPVPTKATT